MKNSLTLLKLTLAILAVTLAHLWLSCRDGNVSTGLSRATLAECDSRDVGRVEIQRGGNTRAVLVNTGSWSLVEPFRSDVDLAAVNRLLDALCYAPVSAVYGMSELVRNGHSPDEFGLGGPCLRVQLVCGESSVGVAFGAYKPAAGGVYAAVDGIDAVYIVSTNVFAAADVGIDGLRSRALFPPSAEAAKAFEIRNGSSGSSRLRFVRQDGKWMLTEPRAAVAAVIRVDRLLADFSAANAVDFVWPVGGTNEEAAVSAALLAGYGLDAESAVTLSVKGGDGVSRTVAFGADAGNDKVYALVHNGTAVVTVPAALKDALSGDVVDFTDTRLFPLDPARVGSLSVVDGKTRCLAVCGADGAWQLEAPVVAPADARAIQALLDRALALRASDIEAGGPLVSLGTNTVPMNVSREALLGGLRLDDLRAKDILRIDPASVKRLVSVVGDGVQASVVFDRDRKVWNVESAAGAAAADPAAVETVLKALSPLQAERIVTLKAQPGELRAFGLEKPGLTIAVDQDREDAVRRNVLIGEIAPEGGRYATVGANDAVFILSVDTVSRLSQSLTTTTP